MPAWAAATSINLNPQPACECLWGRGRCSPHGPSPRWGVSLPSDQRLGEDLGWAPQGRPSTHLSTPDSDMLGPSGLLAHPATHQPLPLMPGQPPHTAPAPATRRLAWKLDHPAWSVAAYPQSGHSHWGCPGPPCRALGVLGPLRPCGSYGTPSTGTARWPAPALPHAPAPSASGRGQGPCTAPTGPGAAGGGGCP